MRWASLILVGISTLGCGNKDAAKPAKGSAAPTAPTAPTTAHQTTPDQPPPELPKDPGPKAVHDQEWQTETAKTIVAVAPDLSNVSCKEIDCSATLTAPNMDALVARAEKLQDEDSLHQLEDARGIVLSKPVTKDGKASMTIRILFDQ